MNTVEYGRENRDVILLLHGGGLSWWNYREVAARLADRYHVVIPILDGHAGSSRPFTSMRDNALEIITYIDEAFSGHVLLLGGLSLGGQILVEILSLRGSICDYAIIESALVLPMRLTAALIRPSFSLCYPLIRQRWFARLQFRSLRIRPELFEDYYRDTARIARDDMVTFLMANADFSISRSLSACTAKTLILVGSREQGVMKRSAHMLASALPSAELEILKGLHHGEFSINHAQRYADRLLQLISQQGCRRETVTCHQ